MKIAVIGSGISGLSSAYFLSKKFKVDLFEKEDRFGGHSFTFDIKEKDKVVPVDLGFIVFNALTYPKLIKFFEDLKVPYEKSDMSFSVSIQNTDIEYSGSGLGGIFANKFNLFDFSIFAHNYHKYTCISYSYRRILYMLLSFLLHHTQD